MKQLFTILFFLCAVASQAQTIIDNQYYQNLRRNDKIDRIVTDSILAAPSVKAAKGKRAGSFMYNSTIKSFELYDSITATWYPLYRVTYQDGLISGGIVTWLGNLDFYVSNAIYAIGGTPYGFSADTVTLDAADPSLPRIDVIVLDTSGNVAVVKGTPAADPAKPQTDPASQIELTQVLINAGTTVPGNITQFVVWDENTESTVTGSFTFNANNTTNPFHLTKAVDVSSHGGGGSLSFELPSGITLTDYTVFTFYIRQKGAYSNSTSINVEWSKPSGFFDLAVTNNVNITNNNYGYSASVANQYQTIQIPLSAFTFYSSPSNVNKLTLSWSGAGSGFYLDYIQLQSGITVSGSGVTTFNGRNGNVTPLKSDYWQFFGDTSYRRNDSVFWRKDNTEYFQYKDSAGSPLSLDDVTTIGNFTLNSIRSGAGGFQVRNTGNTQTLGQWFNNGNNNSELYIYNLSTSRQMLLTENKLEFKATGSNYQALKPHPTPTAAYANIFLPNTAGGVYLPTSIKLNGTTYTAGDTGLVDLGTVAANNLINGGNNLGSGAQVFKDTSSNKLNFRSIVAGSGVSVTQNTNDITISASSSAIDTGTIANRPVSPIFGQRYYQTDELVGMYTYTPRGWQWLFPETIYDIKFHSMTGSTNPRIATFVANGGAIGSSTTFVNGMNETGWFNTGSNANGVAGFRLNTGQAVSSFNMRNRYMVFQFRVAFNLLSDGTNRYVAYLGTKQLEQSDGTSNSIFWRYSDSLNSGRWQLVIVDASGTTTINTTVAVDDSTSYNLVVQKEPAFIRAFINGTKVGEAVFNEGATAFPALFNGAIRKTVGTTARILIIDKIRLYEY